MIRGGAQGTTWVVGGLWGVWVVGSSGSVAGCSASGVGTHDKKEKEQGSKEWAREGGEIDRGPFQWGETKKDLLGNGGGKVLG